MPVENHSLHLKMTLYKYTDFSTAYLTCHSVVLEKHIPLPLHLVGEQQEVCMKENFTCSLAHVPELALVLITGHGIN